MVTSRYALVPPFDYEYVRAVDYAHHDAIIRRPTPLPPSHGGGIPHSERSEQIPPTTRFAGASPQRG